MEKKVSLMLVEKAAKGNREAFGELIVKYQAYLYKIAYMYTKNEQDALDAVQECAMRAMIAMDKLRDARYFKTWITRILINSVYHLQGKTKKNVVFEEYKETVCGDGISIEEKLDIYDAIDLLPPVYKTVIILQYADGKLLPGGSSSWGSTFAISDRDVSKIYVYLCDMQEYLDELRGYRELENFRQILEERALYGKEIEFTNSN